MILFVTNDVPTPVVNGGRARIHGLRTALEGVAPVVVAVAQGRRGGSEVTADCVRLPAVRRTRLAAAMSAGPRLGRGLLDDHAVDALRELARSANVIVVSHSYLMPLLPDLHIRVVLDVPNVEVDRQRSTGGAVGRIESLKAQRWEPRAVRRAAVCLAVDEHDVARLRRWGARQVLVVPNTADVPVSPPSPAGGHVLAVADWTYAPNRRSLDGLLASGLRCVFAGRGSEHLPGGLGYVHDLAPLYDGAACVVAPAERGAGTQLKTVEAVLRGRVVVTSRYGRRSVPEPVRHLCPAGDIVVNVRRLLDDVHDRHGREALLRTAPLPRGWTEAAAPLTRELRGLRA